ncbi:MAG: type 2 isopentenyl-diphosphate Delta-isomerase [Candidatus Hermodarchaeota archaeon]
MKEKGNIIILKLGGSLITDKNEPFSIRKDVIENSINQIIESKKEKLIIVHGGGSFGHPVAKQYKISNGLDLKIKDQIFGLTKTHEVMNRLNTYLINSFLEKNQPAMAFQASSIFLKDFENIFSKSISIIEKSLNLGVIPILYGDIIFEKNKSFSIISGDRIILELCRYFEKGTISKVIFATEVDGIFVRESERGEEKILLAQNVDCSELDRLNLAQLSQKIDVTGGIRGKINSIKEICELNIEVQILNGLKDGYLLKALKGQNIECTKIMIPSYLEKTKEISKRKIEHLKIPINYNVQHLDNYFKYIKLIHHPLPEYDFNEIDLSTTFFNKKISAPICIAAITGGHSISKELNRILAQAAEQENIIMSVGSQRAGLVDPSLIDSFRVVREVAPNIPIIGNIGIGQLSDPDFKVDDFKKCIEMIDADVMAIHFNALHELVQEKGDRSYKNFQKNFEKVRNSTDIPIIAKEVGSGFNQELAITLDKLGIDGFDVGGAGGTSFAAIESVRNKNSTTKFTRNPGDLFREWGIPTPVSIYNVRKVTNKLIIATGGLNTGIDIAKSIILGADIGGFAYKFLLTSWKDYENHTTTNSLKEISTLKNELRSCLWLMNLKNTSELKNNKNKRVVLGKLHQWIKN